MDLISESRAWNALTAHHKEVEPLHMQNIISRDPDCYKRFSLHLGDILFNYSKNRITEKILPPLIAPAEETGLPCQIYAMFK